MAKIHSFNKGLVCILSTWGDSHQLNRMLMLENYGLNTVSLAYSRAYYPSKVSKPDVSLGNLKHGNYLLRIFAFLRSLIIVKGEIKRNGPAVYVFGLDNLIQVYLIKMMLTKRVVIFYEISDIRAFETRNSILSRLLRLVYSQALRSVDQLIVTSPEFVTGYLSEYVGFHSKNYIVMENKVHSSMVKYYSEQADRQPTNASKKIRIGYFGLLRCNRSIEILLDLADDSDEFHIVFRGILFGINDELVERINLNKNTSFHGPYHSPEDLRDLYQDIDVSWICYPYSEKKVGNWQWARTNRYYEGGYFEVPMVASSHTVDGNNVLLKRIGWCIDLSNPDMAKKALVCLTRKEIEKVKENYSKISRQEFEVSNDYEFLASQINDLYE